MHILDQSNAWKYRESIAIYCIILNYCVNIVCNGKKIKGQELALVSDGPDGPGSNNSDLLPVLSYCLHLLRFVSLLLLHCLHVHMLISTLKDI